MILFLELIVSHFIPFSLDLLAVANTREIN